MWLSLHKYKILYDPLPLMSFKRHMHILIRSHKTHSIKRTLIFFILSPGRCYVNKLFLYRDKQFAPHGGKAHHQYVQLRWGCGCMQKWFFVQGVDLAAGRYHPILCECLIFKTFDILKNMWIYTKINQVESIYNSTSLERKTHKTKNHYIA